MPKKLYRAEIAFAMEMMSQGWQQQHIAKALSVKPESLRYAIRKAMNNGAKESSAKQTTVRRIRHTNKLAESILAEKSSSHNLPRKRQKNQSSDATAGSGKLPRVGGAASHPAI